MTKTRSIVVICPGCNTEYIYDYTTEPRIWCKKCNKQFRFKSQLSASQSSPKQKILEKTQGPDFIPPHNKSDFIDDPDELLMSVAIRELNKSNPDPRWASILINCKKENINIKGDDIESFRKLPNQVLATLLSKSKQRMS